MHLKAFVHAQFIKHSQIKKITLKTKSIKILNLTLTTVKMISHTE